jgi:hypothetical protein
MGDEKEAQEARINQNVEALRRIVEPLAADLAPDVEPAVMYQPRPTVSVEKTSHDHS